MLTYGLLLQIIISFIVGVVFAFLAPKFISGLPSQYITISMLIFPISYSLSCGFRKYLDAEGATQLALIMQAAQAMGEVLLDYTVFLILNTFNKLTIFVVLGSQISMEFVIALVTILTVAPCNLSKLSLQFKVSHLQNFKPKIIVMILYPSVMEIVYLI